MTWFNSATTRDEVLATLPGYHEGFAALYGALWQLEEIPATTLELCRLRIAQLHRCPSELEREEQPLPAALRAELADWHRSPAFDAGQKACLAFAEVYCMDPQAISDEQADAVKAAHGEPGLVALIQALGLFYALTRFSQLWGLDEQVEVSA